MHQTSTLKNDGWPGKADDFFLRLTTGHKSGLSRNMADWNLFMSSGFLSTSSNLTASSIKSAWLAITFPFYLPTVTKNVWHGALKQGWQLAATAHRIKRSESGGSPKGNGAERPCWKGKGEAL